MLVVLTAVRAVLHLLGNAGWPMGRPGVIIIQAALIAQGQHLFSQLLVSLVRGQSSAANSAKAVLQLLFCWQQAQSDFLKSAISNHLHFANSFSRSHLIDKCQITEEVVDAVLLCKHYHSPKTGLLAYKGE